VDDRVFIVAPPIVTAIVLKLSGFSPSSERRFFAARFAVGESSTLLPENGDCGMSVAPGRLGGE
jgi:hypothetical protein